MDLNRLTQGEKIAAGAAIALFIIMFLGWFGNDAGSASAWESFDFIDVILTLTIIVALGVAAIRASRSDIELPIPGSTAVALMGGLSTLLILYRIIDTPYGLDREFGVFLGLIAAAAIAYGGWRAMEEEGTTFGDAADRFSGPGAGPDRGDRAATPPPPPSTGSAPPRPSPPPPPQRPGGNPPAGGA